MNRRGFFNLLGKAVLGTAIALNIPETLIPQVPKLSYGQVIGILNAQLDLDMLLLRNAANKVWYGMNC